MTKNVSLSCKINALQGSRTISSVLISILILYICNSKLSNNTSNESFYILMIIALELWNLYSIYKLSKLSKEDTKPSLWIAWFEWMGDKFYIILPPLIMVYIENNKLEDFPVFFRLIIGIFLTLVFGTFMKMVPSIYPRTGKPSNRNR